MKDVKVGASSADAGSVFQNGIVLGFGGGVPGWGGEDVPEAVCLFAPTTLISETMIIYNKLSVNTSPVVLLCKWSCSGVPRPKKKKDKKSGWGPRRVQEQGGGAGLS